MLLGIYRASGTFVSQSGVQDKEVDLLGADDPAVLAWAAPENRVLLTHDVATIPQYVLERLQNGQALPGIIFINDSTELKRAMDELCLAVTCLSEEEMRQRVFFYMPE